MEFAFQFNFSGAPAVKQPNFRIQTPNQEKFISTDIYRKSYTRYSPTLSGTRIPNSSNSACKIIVLSFEVSARFSEYLFLSIAAKTLHQFDLKLHLISIDFHFSVTKLRKNNRKIKQKRKIFCK